MKNFELNQIRLTGFCNNNCFFCMTEHEKPLMDLDKIKQYIDKIEPGSYVNIFGGEPTVHPLFFETMEYIKNKNLLVNLQTNLRMFSDKNFQKKIIKYENIKFIFFTLLGHNEEIHDSLTQKNGSFNETLKGVNFINNNMNLFLHNNTVFCKSNYLFLENIVELLDNLKIHAISFANLFIYEEIDKLINNICKFDELKFRLNKALKKAQKHGFIVSLSQDIPFCLAPEYIGFFNNYNKKDFEYFHYNYFIKPEICRKECELQEICIGITPYYRKLYKKFDVFPIKNFNPKIKENLIKKLEFPTTYDFFVFLNIISNFNKKDFKNLKKMNFYKEKNTFEIHNTLRKIKKWI